MSTDLELRLRQALHDDAGRAHLVNPDRPADAAARPQSVARPPGRLRWRGVAVAAAVALVVAGVMVTRNRDAGTGVTTSPGPAEVFPDLAPGATVILPPGPISPLDRQASIWTGTEVIVWGEPSASDATSPPEGAAFNPATGAWRIIAPAPVPQADVVAWTGTEMIVWGGRADSAAYDPEADTWRRLPEAPIAGGGNAAAVWTGTELIVIRDPEEDRFDDPLVAAAYDPATNEWRALAETNGDISPYVSPIVATEGVSQPVWTGTTVLIILGVLDPGATGANNADRVLARYEVSTDTWHIDADAHYSTLVGIPDAEGVTRTVLAMPVAPGEPVELLDAAGDPIGSLPAHPVDVGGFNTDAAGLWLGHEALFWIRGADWVVQSTQLWALNPATRAWR